MTSHRFRPARWDGPQNQMAELTHSMAAINGGFNGCDRSQWVFFV